ncbi:MAG: hypothetical protein J6X45_06550, partial [Lachnospiraceae bacterium]|nr:hypothetical protein [Lachnospiraceae bacterium]
NRIYIVFSANGFTANVTRQTALEHTVDIPRNRLLGDPDFDEWEEEMKSIYSRYNSELGHTFNQEIKDHVMINNDVRMTVYEDGTKVYVNYGYETFNYNGVKIPARDYLVVR